MDKIIKKFVVSFVLIAIIPCLSLILFQKFQTENQTPPPIPPMALYMPEQTMPPMAPNKPPIAIPIIVMSLSCFGLCFIWMKYLKKTFLTPLKNIIDFAIILHNCQFTKGVANILIFFLQSSRSTIVDFCLLYFQDFPFKIRA